MNNRTLTLIICAASFALGILVLAFNREWIVVRFSSRAEFMQPTTSTSKNRVVLYFWRNNAWQHETTDILVSSDDKALTITHLINSWLALLDDEHITKKNVSLQSVLLSASQHEAYISFDRNPLHKEDNIYAKWMWIEGLLKTLRDNDIKIQNVHFLVHHQPLTDYHLDFSNAWPLQGFL